MVAEEVPIALEYNGVSHVVMFATPADLEDFARGFTLSEGIVPGADRIYGVEVEPDARGIRVTLEIASEPFALLKERRRALTGRTGCGLCGTESLEHAVRPLVPLESNFCIDAMHLTEAMQQLRKRQTLMQATGAVHAAGWVDGSGELLLVREDVGRHNALDKLIGAISLAGLDFTQGAALITSRASFEMVQKAVTLGMPLLAAVSAPTALAVRMARSARLGLLGFVRDSHYACYSEPGRFCNALGNRAGAASTLESAA
jgi:FdhD protein